MVASQRLRETNLLGELECINKAKGLIDRTSNGKIVDGDLKPAVRCRNLKHVRRKSNNLANNSLRVNDEETPQCNTFILQQNTVGRGDLVVLVAEEGDVDASETSILAGGRGPRKQTVLGVDGGEDDGGTTLLELFGSFGVRNDFGGTEELRLATGWRCGKEERRKERRHTRRKSRPWG